MGRKLKTKPNSKPMGRKLETKPNSEPMGGRKWFVANETSDQSGGCLVCCIAAFHPVPVNQKSHYQCLSLCSIVIYRFKKQSFFENARILYIKITPCVKWAVKLQGTVQAGRSPSVIFYSVAAFCAGKYSPYGLCRENTWMWIFALSHSVYGGKECTNELISIKLYDICRC